MLSARSWSTSPVPLKSVLPARDPVIRPLCAPFPAKQSLFALPIPLFNIIINLCFLLNSPLPPLALILGIQDEITDTDHKSRQMRRAGYIYRPLFLGTDGRTSSHPLAMNHPRDDELHRAITHPSLSMCLFSIYAPYLIRSRST
jgi:hypothetical protein